MVAKHEPLSFVRTVMTDIDDVTAAAEHIEARLPIKALLPHERDVLRTVPLWQALDAATWEQLKLLGSGIGDLNDAIDNNRI